MFVAESDPSPAPDYFTIEELKIPKLTKFALREAGFRTVKQVRDTNPTELMEIFGLSKTGLKALRYVLGEWKGQSSDHFVASYWLARQDHALHLQLEGIPLRTIARRLDVSLSRAHQLAVKGHKRFVRACRKVKFRWEP